MGATGGLAQLADRVAAKAVAFVCIVQHSYVEAAAASEDKVCGYRVIDGGMAKPRGGNSGAETATCAAARIYRSSRRRGASETLVHGGDYSSMLGQGKVHWWIWMAGLKGSGDQG